MPGTLTIDTTATFQAVLLMASGPKLKFGSTEQDISARGERKWDVQAAVTYHAEPGMKPVSEVIAVTVTGPGHRPVRVDRARHPDRVRPDAGRLLCPRGPRERPRHPRRPPLVPGRRRAPGPPAAPRQGRPGRITRSSRPARSLARLGPGRASRPGGDPCPSSSCPLSLWLADPWHDALALVLAAVPVPADR